MHITINYTNISEYRSHPHPGITEVTWVGCPLEVAVLRNLPDMTTLTCNHRNLKTLEILSNCPQLEELECQSCELVTLKGIENCLRLRKLDCKENKLTDLLYAGSCPELEYLDCSKNTIESLKGLSRPHPQTDWRFKGSPKLKRLYCSDNLLQSLSWIDSCPQLLHFFCNKNLLGDLDDIESCTQLITLCCSENQLECLEGIEKCVQLEMLMCWTNQLTTLTGIEACMHLQIVECMYNEITSLEPIICLPNLRSVYAVGNPLEIPSVRVQRRLDQIRSVRRNASIYGDRQNVHDSHIQQTVCASVKNLLSDSKPALTIDSITPHLCADIVELVLRFSTDQTVHSVFMLTYTELLMYVWARIEKHESKDELVKIFSEQALESKGLCFTGRFNRTVSVLVGFYEDIVIEISDSSRIGAIIIAARNRTVPYDPNTHRALAHELLTDAGYDAETIQPWLAEITDTSD